MKNVIGKLELVNARYVDRQLDPNAAKLRVKIVNGPVAMIGRYVTVVVDVDELIERIPEAFKRSLKESLQNSD